MKIPRTVPLGLLLTLPPFGILFLPKHCAFLGEQPLFVKGLLAYGLMALLALGAMAGFGAGRWQDFGFQKAHGPWFKFLLYAVLLGAVCTLALLLITGKGMEGSLKGLKPSQILLLVLVGSIIEEFLMRGWLQGFLQPLKASWVKLGPARVSVPVLTSALAFGAMHLPAGISSGAWLTVFLLVFTTSLGFLAAIIRERTGSLVPAIVTHLAGNAGGILGGLMFLLIQRGYGVHPPHI